MNQNININVTETENDKQHNKKDERRKFMSGYLSIRLSVSFRYAKKEYWASLLHFHNVGSEQVLNCSI